MVEISTAASDVPIPAKCPEPNPTVNLWEFMRDSWLSNRVHKATSSRIAATPGTRIDQP